MFVLAMLRIEVLGAVMHRKAAERSRDETTRRTTNVVALLLCDSTSRFRSYGKSLR